MHTFTCRFVSASYSLQASTWKYLPQCGSRNLSVNPLAELHWGQGGLGPLWPMKIPTTWIVKWLLFITVAKEWSSLICLKFKVKLRHWAARSWLISWQVTLPFDLCTRTSPIFQLTSVMSLRIRRSFGEKEAQELCGRSRRRWCSPPGVWDTRGVREIRLQFASKAGVRCHKATQELVPGLQICHQVSLFLTQLPVSYKSTCFVPKYRSFCLF